jgi:hypothetical protein
MTTEAVDGTYDTTDTGGGASPASSAAPLVLEEGRAFRSDAETRALVNAVYGVADADPYDNPLPEEQVGAPVAADLKTGPEPVDESESVEGAEPVEDPAQPSDDVEPEVEPEAEPEPVVEPEVVAEPAPAPKPKRGLRKPKA